jgi:hypothetical protein
VNGVVVCACDKLVGEATLGAAGFGEKRQVARMSSGVVEETGGCLEMVYNRKNNETRIEQTSSSLYARVV